MSSANSSSTTVNKAFHYVSQSSHHSSNKQIKGSRGDWVSIKELTHIELVKDYADRRKYAKDRSVGYDRDEILLENRKENKVVCII